MTENKTKPTNTSVDDFLTMADPVRADEARTIIDIMQRISGQLPVMWGPSIIGFGTTHYKYDSGREGDMPILGFSPRKAALTIYFMEGFADTYSDDLQQLGPHKVSKACLYITKLSTINLDILTKMLQASYRLYE